MPSAGFEDREDHRTPCASVLPVKLCGVGFSAWIPMHKALQKHEQKDYGHNKMSVKRRFSIRLVGGASKR
jgi:hypothetical protein